MSITRFVTPVAVAVGIAAFATPALAQRRGSHGSSRGTAVSRSRPVYVPRTVIVNRGYYRPYTYYRPYYRFAPRISLGIGLWAGYPVSWSGYYWSGYPYSYGYPYPAYPYYNGYPAPSYPYGTYPPANYPYPPSNYPSANDPSNYPSANYPSGNYPSANYPSSNYPSGNYPSANYPSASSPDNSGYADDGRGNPDTVDVRPGAAPATSGGVSFEIDPPTASVFIDGKYMGTGADFGPNVQPLGLTTGRHRVEIRAEGYESMSFDADVAAGEVTPYKASLRRR
jgi:hypothetical protein